MLPELRMQILFEKTTIGSVYLIHPARRTEERAFFDHYVKTLGREVVRVANHQIITKDFARV